MTLRSEFPLFDTPQLRRLAWAANQRIAEAGLEVPCAMGRASRLLLFQMVRAMGAKTVLDIGTFCGTSAALYALAVGPEGHVVSVDVQDANGASGHWSRIPGARSPRAALDAMGLADRVEFVTCSADSYLLNTPARFDFISIDGWHEAFSVYAEVLIALERLNPDGLIFLDDVHREGHVLPEGHDVIGGPYQAIRWHEQRGTGFRVYYGRSTAFLLHG